MLQGGCHCRAVRYEAAAPRLPSLCWCADCRGTSGAPGVAWFTVDVTAFRITAGEPTRYRSSPTGERTFCPRCGTQLSFRDDATPGELDVSTCSLDDPSAVPPAEHLWVRSKPAWAPLGDALPRYPTNRKRSPE